MSEQGQLPVSGGAASRAQLRDAEAVLAARQGELEATRAVAGKWQAGLATLLAVVTGLSFTSLSEAVRGLSGPYNVIVAVLLLVAFGVAVTSLLLALRASGGFPTLVGTSGQSQDRAAHVEAVGAVWLLRWAVKLTLVVLVLFAVVVGMLWFAPQAKSAGSSAEVKTSKETVCGEAEVSGDHVVVTADDKNVYVFALSDVTSWSNVNKCP